MDHQVALADSLYLFAYRCKITDMKVNQSMLRIEGMSSNLGGVSHFCLTILVFATSFIEQYDIENTEFLILKP